MENEEINPQHQDDVNPSTQQDKIQDILAGKIDEPIPDNNGTGGNNPVNGGESLHIKKDENKKSQQ